MFAVRHMKPDFTSVAALIAHDETSPMERDNFDDALWLLLCEKVTSPEDLEAFRPPVGVYFASRYLEWEVGNGGFAQAAYNIPGWFELAAIGYAALGKPKAVQLIREAQALLTNERKVSENKGLLNGAAIGDVFSHFNESSMAVLDTRIPEDEWWIDDERVDYVRNNKDAFRQIR